MTDRNGEDVSRLAELESRIRQAVDGRESHHWEERQVETSLHQDCLAISWSGTHEYWIALIYEQRVRQAEAALRPGDRLSRGARMRLAAETRAAHDPRARTWYGGHRRDRRPRGFCETFVFYKSSSRLPKSLKATAPGMEQIYWQAPLHHWVAIGRERSAAAVAAGTGFSEFGPLFAPQRDAAALVRALEARIFPEECPMGYRRDDPRRDREGGFSPDPWGPGPGGGLAAPAALAVLLIVVGAIVLMAYPPTRYMVRDAWRNIFAGWPDPVGGGGVVVGDSRLDALYDEYYYLQEQRHALAIVTVTEEAQAVFRIDRQLQQLEHEIVRLGGRPPRAFADHGPRVPPCLPVEWVETDMHPGYVYVVTLRNDGISVAAPQRSAFSEHARYPGSRPVSRGGMDLAAFDRHVRPISLEAERWGCRQFVLLRNDEWIDPDRYTQLREAVSRHFYIHRPPR